MNSQRHSSGSYFGPRQHMSRRLAATNGLSLGKSEGRFRSTRMLEIHKECKKQPTNMKVRNMCKSNSDVNDQANVVKQAKKNPPADSNVGPSNALLVKNSISEYSLASKHALQHTTSSLENSLNPSPMDIECSKPSRARNMLAPKEVEMLATRKTKGDSNVTSRCLDESHYHKKMDKPSRNMETSHPTHLKPMGSLVRRAKNVDTSSLNNDALGSRSKVRLNPYRGEGIDVGKDGTKKLTAMEKREVPRKSNIQMVSGPFVSNKDKSNKEKGWKDGVITKQKGMISHTSGGCATYINCSKQTNTTKTNEAPNASLLIGKEHMQGLGSNLGDNSSHLYGKNHSRHLRENASFMEGSNCAMFSPKHVIPNEFIETNLKFPNRFQLVGGNGKTNDDKFRRKQPLLEENPDINGGIDSDGAVQHDLTFRQYNEDEDNGSGLCTLIVEHDKSVHRENLTSVPTMKRRRCMETNVDEVDGGYQNPFGVENDCEGVERLGTYKSKKKQRKDIDIDMDKYKYGTCDWHRKHCVGQQCYYCSKPIDKPKWSGMFKIDGKKYISLAGHLSTKSCEKVRELSPLPKVVQVTKVPRLAAWPKIWKASKPTGDSIGLYFFPREMRHDEELDQLVKEVIDKDLVLRAVIGEAEMLIFPSVLLPERYQTFQTKHYLWAAFKANEDKCAATVEQEEDREKHVSNQLDDESEESDQEMILMKCAKPLENQQLTARSIHEVETCCIQGPTNTCLEREALEGRRPRDSSHQAVCNSASTAIAIDAATDAPTSANADIIPSEATSFAVNTLFPANHGPMDPSMKAPPSSSSVFSIVIQKTPRNSLKVQELIDKMERAGELVAVMEGVEIMPASGQANTTAVQ